MNRSESKLAISVLAVLIAGIALIYTFIMFPQILFAVMGVSMLFLITAYILTVNIISYLAQRNRSANVQLKHCLDDLSAQIETLSGAQAKLGKVNYLYNRQTAEKISSLESHYTESQAALYKNLSTISLTQNRATKLMIRYDQSNTVKLIAAIKDMRNHLSETMVQGFDQLQPNNEEVVGALTDLITYLKQQPIDESLGVRLHDAAAELQTISEHVVPDSADATPTETKESAAEPAFTPTFTVVGKDTPQETNETDETDEIDAPAAESPTAAANIPAASDDPNRQLSPDEIAVLFAAAAPEPTTDQTPSEASQPTTDVGADAVSASTDTSATTPSESISSPTGVDDPNRQLTPDEIAALFASLG